MNVINNYIEGKISRKQASIMLDVSLKTVSRMKHKYLTEGASAFIHKNTGKVPANKTSKLTENKVVQIYRKYNGFNFTHFLDENPNIKCSLPTLTRILNINNIISPNSHKEKTKQIHPLRKRKECFGELIQMDASKHDWLSNGKYLHLHLAIDDATSKVLAGYFSKEETLNSYLVLYKQILIKQGIPLCFYTDNRTVFKYLSKKMKAKTLTQFQRICASFGTDIKTTSVPQAKGRVERLNRTFQDRLLNELKVNNINDIDKANKYLLNTFIPKINNKFSIPICKGKNAFTSLNAEIDLNIALAIQTKRKILDGNVISVGSKLYKIIDNLKKEIKFMSNEMVTVLFTMDKKLKVEYNNIIYNLLLFQVNNNSNSHPTVLNHPWKNPNNYGKPIWQQGW